MIDNSDEKRSDNSYDKYIESEVVLPDQNGEKLMRKVRKRIKYDDIRTG